jgi:hypothetical protein
MFEPTNDTRSGSPGERHSRKQTPEKLANEDIEQQPKPTSPFKHTPVKKKHSGVTRHSIKVDDADVIYRQIGVECMGKFKVGVNPSKFLSTLLPWNENTLSEYRSLEPPSEKRKLLKDMAEARLEKDMYPLYVSIGHMTK